MRRGNRRAAGNSAHYPACSPTNVAGSSNRSRPPTTPSMASSGRWCKTMSHARAKACCAACIIKSFNHKASSSLSCMVQSTTWPSICGARRRLSANGSASSCADDHQQLWIPKGFAHGFLTLSDWAEVSYKVNDLYCPAGERTLIWNDPTVNVTWPAQGGAFDPVLSTRDAKGLALAQAEVFG